jgi:hypothetical protein
MSYKETILISLLASAIILLSGCATIVNDPNIPLDFVFEDGSKGECKFQNKRGSWSCDMPCKGILIRRSDDNLVYNCTTTDGKELNGAVRSHVEGGKMAASVIFWDLGITDAITDKHRRYQKNVIIPIDEGKTVLISDQVTKTEEAPNEEEKTNDEEKTASDDNYEYRAINN